MFPIMEFNKDFDSEIVAQLYATIHLHDNEERSMTWMASGRLLKADCKTFMNSLGYSDNRLEEPLGFRPHKDTAPIQKSKSIRYSRHVTTAKGVVRTKLIPFLDIMHCIFLNTHFPPIGNMDQVHSYLMHLLPLCIDEKGKVSTLDVSHIMWCELHSAVLDKKVPSMAPILLSWLKIHGLPCIQISPLILSTWWLMGCSSCVWRKIGALHRLFGRLPHWLWWWWGGARLRVCTKD